MDIKQNWLQLTLIQTSGALSLPVLMAGYFLGSRYNLQEITFQIIGGNIILLAIAVLFSFVIHRYQIVTIEFAQRLFGSKGSIICAASLAISLIGWSTLQLHVVNSIIVKQLNMITMAEQVLTGCLFGGLIYFLTFKGLIYFASINKILVPILVVILLYTCLSPARSIIPITLSAGQHATQMGLMTILTIASAVVFDLPTFYKHAKSKKAAVSSLVVLFLFILPIIEALGVYLGRHNANEAHDLINAFLSNFSAFPLFFLSLSAILTSCMNLYSMSVTVNRTFGFSFRKILLGGVFICTALSYVKMDKQWSIFLEVINVSSEVVTILILSYFLFNGLNNFNPNRFEQVVYQIIFYLIIFYVACEQFLRISIFQDLIVDVAFLTFLLIALYSTTRMIWGKVHAIFDY